MTMKFYINNLVNSATITASENNSLFPSSNLKDERRSKVYRSLSNSCNIVFDFGSSKEIDCIAIVDSKMNSFGFSSAIIELNNLDSWASPAISQTLTIDSFSGWINFNWSLVQNYRYARLVLTNLSSPVELSKIFIGKSSYSDGVCFSYPLNFIYNNQSNVVRNRYGQKFVDKIVNQKQINGTIPLMNKAEFDLLLTVIDYASFTKPIWLSFDASNSLVNPNRISGYYYLNDDPKLDLQTGNFWNVNLSLTEGT